MHSVGATILTLLNALMLVQPWDSWGPEPPLPSWVHSVGDPGAVHSTLIGTVRPWVLGLLGAEATLALLGALLQGGRSRLVLAVEVGATLGFLGANATLAILGALLYCGMAWVARQLGVDGRH